MNERPTILLVDDTPANLNLLANLLKDEYRIKLANNGQKALEVANTSAPDMVLLDIMMPQMDGFEVCRRLKASDATRNIPVIFLTAKNEIEDEELGFEVGAVDFIQKPISAPIVIARVRAHLQNKLLQDSLQVRNQFIKKTFGRYMSDEVVGKLLDFPDGLNLGGESLTVTIVMTDLRGFSAISEALPPEIVVEMLNSYLSDMTHIICKYAGTINEIIGDALLILFGAPTMRPDDADRAIACALEMQLAMEGVNRRHRALGLPELEMGIGINTGCVVAGNIGSDIRVKYAVVGSNVNLAGRVESFTVGNQVLITESTLKATGLKVSIGKQFFVSFKGLLAPVNVYDVTGVSGRYEISLPQSVVIFAQLTDAIALSFERLDGKLASGELEFGRIVRLAEKSAVLETTTRLAALDNLKIRLTDRACHIIYAKVVSSSESDCCEIRFTSLPEEICGYFEPILNAARKNSDAASACVQ